MDRWLKILLVDDDEDDYVLTRELLSEVKRDQFQLDWVSQYDEALSAMCANEHDAYLLDYRLGPDSGLDLLKDAVDSGCTAPIIFLTGKGAPEIDVKAMEAGASEYLVKGELNAQMLERTIRYAIEHKAVERELAEARQRLAESRENERIRLAQELHDGPVQDLYGVRFQLKSLLNSVEDDAVAPLAEIQRGLQQVTRTLRAISGKLRPPTLAPFGLDVALRSHAEDFSAAHPALDLQLQLDADGPKLSEDVRHALYRIFQHSLNNVAQHADASYVHVRFAVENNRVILELEDDGCGFTVPDRWTQLARNGHLGMLGAAERAESIGGRLDVQSAPGEGTLVRVTVPLATASAPAQSACD